MATKTVVCPECGSEAAPGRYACTECGALLAAVALTPRTVTPVEPTPSEPTPAEPTPSDAMPVTTDDAGLDGAAGTGRAAATDGAADDAPLSMPQAPEWPDPEVARQVAATVGTKAMDGPDDAAATFDPEDDPAAGGSAPFDENAPLAAARTGPPPAAAERAVPDVLHAATHAPAGDAADAAADRLADESLDVPAAGPSWPPAGTIGTIVGTEPRTPAGAYLPPSAVLPPLDGPGATVGTVGTVVPAGGGPGAVGAAGAAGVQGAPGVATAVGGRSAADALERGATAIGDVFGSARISTDAARRAVAAGAGLAALGVLLPWVNSLPGTSPFTGYLERWGLAAPGLWLVFLAAVGLAAVAASAGRTAAWPVGLPALVGAGFLVGLIWPYAVGGGGRTIGIWTVGVGIVVLIVGGILERRSRHEPGDPSV